MSRHEADFITSYIKLMNNTESHPIYHLWTSIMLISSCLRRKTWLPWGFEKIYPNLYTVLVGPPGGRKGTAMKPAKEMLRQIDVPLSSDCITRERLFQEVAAAKDNYQNREGQVVEYKALSIWSEEFQSFIGSRNPDLIIALTDLFDCPEKWVYGTKGKGSDDLSMSFLSIFGAIQPKILQDSLTLSMSGSGFLSRIIFVVGYGKYKSVPQPFLTIEEEELFSRLVQDLEQIKQMAGVFRFTEATQEAYNLWYNDPNSIKVLDDTQFGGYNARRALHLRKLCIIISASDSTTKPYVVTKSHFEIALAILQFTEREMPNAFYGLGRGDHAMTMADISRYLLEVSEATSAELLDRFRLDVLEGEFDKIMNVLEHSGRVTKEMSNTGSIRYCIEETITETLSDELLKRTVFKHYNFKES